MPELDLLKSLPKPKKRDIKSREINKSEEVIRISREYGQMYFDGPREYGYGGYNYDGRWVPVAKDIIEHFKLKPGSKVLDVGCAKGFLVKDLLEHGIDAYGLDISEYAISNCEKEVIGRLQVGKADNLPFPDNSFDAVISINTIHNYDKKGVVKCLKEIQRLSAGKSFIQVDSYRNADEKAVFESWVLTAYFHDYPENWIKLFKEAGYTGYYYWTII
jgi:ubiquinone/menaquinone biosynthesis C-methylase UbiE